LSGLFLSFNLPPRPAAASDGILGETALEDLVDDDLTYRDRQLHRAFQEENKRFIIHHSSFILSPMLGITLSNDPLSDKRFDFQFVNPPYGNEWSKDYDAVTTEAARGFDGRFGAGLPRKSDGQMLFIQHFIARVSFIFSNN